MNVFVVKIQSRGDFEFPKDGIPVTIEGVFSTLEAAQTAVRDLPIFGLDGEDDTFVAIPPGDYFPEGGSNAEKAWVVGSFDDGGTFNAWAIIEEYNVL